MAHLPQRVYLFSIFIFFSLVFLLAVWIIIWANGFRIIGFPPRLEKTGVITLRFHPNTGSSVLINHQPTTTGKTDFTNLLPGRYTIEVSNPCCFTWEKTVTVVGGDAARFENIVLFNTAPVVQEITDTKEIDDLQRILEEPVRYRQGIQILDNEVWVRDRLITRYSQTIEDALWLIENKQLLIIVNQELHVLDIDGSNDIHLPIPIKIEKGQVAIVSGGAKLAIKENDRFLLYTITDRFPLFDLQNLTNTR